MKVSALYQLSVCAAFVAASPLAAATPSSPRARVTSTGRELRASATTGQRGRSDQPRRTTGLRQGAVLPVAQRREAPRSKRGADESSPSRAGTTRILSGVAPIRHKVLAGETLGEIARRAATTVEVLSALNSLGKQQSLQVGQVLVLPGVAPSPRASWQSYARPPRSKGLLDLSTHRSRFSGQAMGPDGRLRSETVRALNGLLGAGGSHPVLPERLVRLLIEVSDTFGGRPLRLVSGYRRTSYFQDSRHKYSSAIDFMVVGVPNAIVCEYLREIEDVGVGYYPNSSFVHLDVRDHSAYWVDYAGPGEPPRSTPNAPPNRSPSRPPRPADRKLAAALDRILEQTKRGLNETGDGEPSKAPTVGKRQPEGAGSSAPAVAETAPQAPLDELASSAADRDST